MRFLKYYGDILKINIDSLINVYADFKNLEIIDSRNNLRAIKERINNCYFICKNELIYIVLKLYLFLLDGREVGVQPDGKFFEFVFLESKERVVLKTRDIVTNEIKIMSLHSPFIIDNNEYSGQKILKSRFYTDRIISTSELIVLVSYFEESIFLEYEKKSLYTQLEIIEKIQNDLKKFTEGYADIDLYLISELVGELQFLDTSYLRYDIDLSNSLQVDSSFKLNKSRIAYHPPYHIDSDYREKSNYKLGFSRKISDTEFLNIFQLRDSPAKIIVEDFDKYGALENDVRKYKNKLDFNDPEIKRKYIRK